MSFSCLLFLFIVSLHLVENKYHVARNITGLFIAALLVPRIVDILYAE